jgi:hypothetical protein
MKEDIKEGVCSMNGENERHVEIFNWQTGREEDI